VRRKPLRKWVLHCYQHDPAYSAKRKQDAAKAGRRRVRKGRLQAEIHMVKDRLGSLAEAALAGEIDAHTAAVVTQVYNARLRAIDIGMKVEEFEEMVGRDHRVRNENAAALY
jgi:Mg-chelatase subunit ChlI